MKQRIIEKLEIPQGISCTYNNKILTCKKDTTILSRPLHIPKVEIIVDAQYISFICDVGNKKEEKCIRSALTHIKNMFRGLQQPYVYTLEACNVHFPMTLKLENSELIINNFLGEKVPRRAKILPGVHVGIKGAKIILSSPEKEAAGQTAANIEKATKIRKRDRRVFQDGIFITSKPGGKE